MLQGSGMHGFSDSHGQFIDLDAPFSPYLSLRTHFCWVLLRCMHRATALSPFPPSTRHCSNFQWFLTANLHSATWKRSANAVFSAMFRSILTVPILQGLSLYCFEWQTCYFRFAWNTCFANLVSPDSPILIVGRLGSPVLCHTAQPWPT